MTLTVGTKLGPYEVLSPLGAGGMGEVYRARDGRLGRDVAIKVLPEAVAHDPERLARFEREAKLLAALNHANVAAIHGLEESNGVRFLVLELVPGETLAERLAAGPIPPDEALTIARGIAEALEAAHESGMVHRDLKPANIKVTPSGKVKVLDFGLAKAFGAESSGGRDLSHSPTVTSGGTQQGVILGTAAYMSPEQARGKPVDRRSDVWSFGCVLYEMLSGKQAFSGETVSDLVASVLTREPDWDALPAATPPRIRTLLRRCLRKDPEQRLRDVADARLEIEDDAREPAATPELRPPASKGIPAGLIAGTALASAALAALLTWFSLHRASRSAMPHVAGLSRITPPTARSEWPIWSPDGSLIAYASNRGGDFEIYVRRGEGGQDIDVTNDPGQDVQPAFSPDGGFLAFVSTRASKTGLIKIGGTLSRNARTFGGDLWVVPSLGGAPRRLAPDANYPVWRPDGKSILYVAGPENRRQILEVPFEGGTPRAVLPSKESNWEIVSIGCSPDGRWISFESQLEEVFRMPSAGGKAERLFPGFSHAWDGSSRRLWSLARDSAGGTRIQYADLDSPAAVPKTVSFATEYLRDLAISRDGRRILLAEAETSRNLVRLPLTADGGAPAGPEEPLSTGRVIDGYPAVSPDGRRVAYISDILGRMETWILDLETRRRQRIQFPSGDLAQVAPAWLPDGKQIVIARYLPNGENSVWMVAPDGTRTEELFRGRTPGTSDLRPSRDGRTMIVSDTLVDGVQQLVRYDFTSRARAVLTTSPGDKFDSAWSPDGRWLAVTASKDGTIQLFRMPASGGPMQQLTTGYERMRHPSYSPDGKWIYVQPSHRNVCRVRAEGGPLEQVTRFPEAGLFLEEPTISPDGKYLVYARENGGSSIWMMQLQ